VINKNTASLRKRLYCGPRFGGGW